MCSSLWKVGDERDGVPLYDWDQWFLLEYYNEEDVIVQIDFG